MSGALEVQVASLMGLVSAKVGIIRRCERRITSVDEPPLPIIYDSLLSHFDFKKGRTLERGACGKGLTETAAQIGALGEAIEHYCASHARVRSIRRGRCQDIEHAVAPPEFVPYSDSQYARKGFPYARWTPESEIGWFSALELPSRTPVWVPAGLIYLNFTGEQPQDFLFPPTSSGSAAGPDVDAAILRGLLEVAERDAFVITWMNRLDAPALDFASLDGPCALIRDHYARYGVETRAYLLPTDLPVYVVLALGVDRSGNGPSAVAGLGCDFGPEAALVRALFEVCQIHPAEKRKFLAGEARTLNEYSSVHGLEEHALYFARLDHLNELDFLLSGAKVIDVADLPQRSTGSVAGDLEMIVTALGDVGSRAFYTEITTPDLAGFPIRVVRTLATHLQPISFGHALERLGGHRLYEIPRLLGYGPETRTESSLNPCPHPLA